MKLDELGLAAGARVVESAARRVDADVMLPELRRASVRRTQRLVLATAVVLVTVVVVAMVVLAGSGVRTAPQPPAHPTPMRAVHHNGVIAVGSSSGPTVDPETGAVSDQLGGWGGSAHAWSPDGRQIVFTADHELRLYAMGSNGPYRRLATVDGPDFAALAWSPDGSAVARASASGIAMYSPSSGKLLRTLELPASARPSLSLSWSPDGSSLVYGAGRALYVVSADGSGLHSLKAAVVPGEGGPLSPSWSPDGTRIAYLEVGQDANPSARLSVMLVDPAGAARVRVADGGQIADKATVPNLTWSPDGRRLAVVGFAIDGQPDFELFVMNPDGSGRIRLLIGVTDPAAAWRPVP